MKLEHKRILLTGADGGIGSAIATKLHQQGCKLVLAGRNKAPLDQLNESLNQQHSVIALDLSTQQNRQNLFDQIKDSGGIDGLINNAGISEFTFIEQQDASALERLISINLISPMILCQNFISLLKQRDEAFIMNMGSTFGSIGYPGFSAYAASKFGMRGYTETLRRELSDSAIRVFYLAQRATNTPINPPAVVATNKKLGNAMDEPKIVADALVTMLTNNQTSRYLGWPEKLFVRVNSLFPTIVDNALCSKLALIRDYANNPKPLS